VGSAFIVFGDNASRDESRLRCLGGRFEIPRRYVAAEAAFAVPREQVRSAIAEGVRTAAALTRYEEIRSNAVLRRGDSSPVAGAEKAGGARCPA